MRRLLAFCVTAIACLTTTLFAQVESGPEVGKPVPALTVRPVNNGRAAEPIDVAKDRAEQPTVYVLLPASRFDRPAARVVKGLDAAVQKAQVQHPTLALVLVWIADDAEAGATRVSQIQGSLQLSAQWTVFAPSNGPEGWALSDKASLTAVIARKQKVAARFGYDSVNETVLPEIEKAVTAAVQ